MKIATWNVNSVRAREAHLCRWLQQTQPDIVVLQEIKCEATAFPTEAIAALGYRSEVVGQKSYNGVAALGRIPFRLSRTVLPGTEPDPQSRYIEIEAEGLTIGGLYLPNGNSGAEPGYRYKLDWMDRLHAHAAELLDADTPCVLLGDYNVCPEDIDFAPGTLSATDALIRPETRARFRALQWLGLTDAVRALQPAGPAYTFWDYQAGAWPRDRGLRIDHALISPTLADRLTTTHLSRQERAQPQPSDHIPLTITLTP